MRFRSRSQVERADCETDDLWLARNRPLPDLSVYDPGDRWAETGLLNADGDPIEKFIGMEPLGFLHDAKRGRP
jgi:hypothetical protein